MLLLLGSCFQKLFSFSWWILKLNMARHISLSDCIFTDIIIRGFPLEQSKRFTDLAACYHSENLWNRTFVFVYIDHRMYLASAAPVQRSRHAWICGFVKKTNHSWNKAAACPHQSYYFVLIKRSTRLHASTNSSSPRLYSRNTQPPLNLATTKLVLT